MRFRFFIALILLGCNNGVTAAQQPSPTPKPAPPLATPQAPEVEKIQPRETRQSLPAPSSNEAGYMEPEQVKAYLHKVWLAEFRINDLLTQVHPEQWKMSEVARDSFSKTLGTLRVELGGVEQWRDQFDKRPDSMYLGYETYVALGAVLPRLNGVARSVTQHENASLGAQYTQAENQLFDLQQALRLYLSFLLRNQDQLLLAAQNNLATCQNELGFAMRGHAEPAKPMKNTMTGRPARRHSSHAHTKPGQK